VTIRGLVGIVLARVTAPVTLVVGLSVTVVLALAGPFGTYDGMSLPLRLGYWGLIVFSSIPFGYGTRYLAASWAPAPSTLSIVIVPATLMTVAYTPVLYLIVRHVGQATGAPMQVLIWLGGLVAIVSVCVNCVRWALGRTAAGDLASVARTEDPPAAAVEPVAAAPRLLSRLDGLPCTEVLRLSARDHYVDVVTRRARKSLLLRLSDAMAEVEGIPGAQVHRSHWVAQAAVARARRQGTRIVLDLVDGSTVPVSRGYRDRAEAAGLLDGLEPERLAAAE